MKKLWFKAKRYGYGWYPATKEGWLVMLVWVVFFVAGEMVFIKRMYAYGNPKEVFWFLPYVFVITGILIWVCKKTGEEARWRWGEKGD